MHLGFQHVGLITSTISCCCAFFSGKKAFHLGVLVADEAPVEPRQKVEDVNKRGQEVDEAHPAEPVLLVGFRRVKGRMGRRSVLRCPSTIPAGCGSASRATSYSPIPRPCPTPTPQDDIRGIGARCTRCWSTSGRCRSSGAQRVGASQAGRIGLPVEPASSIAHSLPDFRGRGSGGARGRRNRSASTLLNLLQQATAVADRTEVLGPIDDVHRRPPAAAGGRKRRPCSRRRT